MNEPGSTSAIFETWETPACQFSIEYRQGLMQELRAAVAYGQQAFTRGGMEVGGVLFGTRTPAGLSIRMWRPIGCEHASGPAFVLSERDRAELRKFLATASSLPDLAAVEPVGWFLSHTRSDLSLRESDLALFNDFFPGVTDVALVLRPGRHNAARAGFFFREPGGAIQSDRSALEFNIDAAEDVWPVMHAESAPSRGRDLPLYPERRPTSAPSNLEATLAAAKDMAARQGELEPERMPSEQAPPRLTSARSWRWIALPLAALLAIGWLHFSRTAQPDVAETPIDMTLTDHDGQLLIAWDHARNELSQVRGGHILISDGSAKRDIVLSPEQARTGSLTWTRTSSDVLVSLRLDTPVKPLAASSRFLGSPPPASPAEVSASDALHRENQELRRELESTKTRAAEAETAFRALQKRIELENGARK